MILNINQIKNRPKPVYEIINAITGDKLADANSFDIAKPQLIYPNGDQYSVNLTPKSSKRVDGKNRLICDIFSNDNLIGGIYQWLIVQKKFLFIPVGYEYYGLLFNEMNFQIFEIGLGGNQHYLCFYKDDKLVSIVHKHMKVINSLDTYTAYLEDEEYQAATCIFTLYLDELDYYNSNEVVMYKESNEEYISINEELNKKYDPTFITRIMAMDRVVE